MAPAVIVMLTLLTAAPKEEPAAAVPSQRARTVAGKIAEVRLAEGSLSLELRDGSLRLQVDRNTAVFLPGRQGTLRDLSAGEPVRASVLASGLVTWVEVHPRGVVPTARAGEAGPSVPGAAK